MRNWERPMVVVDTFAANEFVSSCGDKGTIYKFECNARGGKLYYYQHSDGQIDGEHNPGDTATRLGNYNPCGVTHQAPKTDAFYDGFVDYNKNGRQDNGEGVIVWRETWYDIFGNPHEYQGHATSKLDMNSWETAKS